MESSHVQHQSFQLQQVSYQQKPESPVSSNFIKYGVIRVSQVRGYKRLFKAPSRGAYSVTSSGTCKSLRGFKSLNYLTFHYVEFGQTAGESTSSRSPVRPDIIIPSAFSDSRATSFSLEPIIVNGKFCYWFDYSRFQSVGKWCSSDSDSIFPKLNNRCTSSADLYRSRF